MNALLHVRLLAAMRRRADLIEERSRGPGPRSVLAAHAPTGRLGGLVRRSQADRGGRGHSGLAFDRLKHQATD